MTAILNRIIGFFRPNVQGSSPSKSFSSSHPTVNATDQKMVKVANRTIKMTQQEAFINSIKDRKEKQQLKNSRNIFEFILTVDFSKHSIKSKDIKIAMDYCLKKAALGHVTEEEQKEISAFFDKISELPEQVFNRPECLGGQFALQKLLSPDLAQLWDLQDKNPGLKEDTRHQLNISIAKAKLSAQLGYGIKAAGNGVNGAQLIKDLEGNYVGVFKPKPDLQWYQIGESLKRYFGQARLLNQKDEMGQQFAEVAAYQFDEIMGFKLAPAATMAEMTGNEGAFLAFLKGYKPLKECEGKLEQRHHYDHEEKRKWQMMCIYNFLVGNLDPHNENVFMKMDEKGHIGEIRMIDHGNCFIEQNPGEGAPVGNQGHWGTYKISGDAFTSEVREFIRDNLTEDKLDEFVQSMQRDPFWTLNMDQLQRQRLSVLRNGVVNGEISSPRELAKLHTARQLDKYAHEESAPSDLHESTLIGSFAVLDIGGK